MATPDAQSEDDGILLIMAYDFKELETSLFAIDALTMKTKQQFKLPFALPMQVHASFIAGYDYTDVNNDEESDDKNSNATRRQDL